MGVVMKANEVERWAYDNVDGYDPFEIIGPILERRGISVPFKPFPVDLLFLMVILDQQEQIDKLTEVSP